MVQIRHRGLSATLAGLERMKARMLEKSWNQIDLVEASEKLSPPGVSLSTVKRLYRFKNVDTASIAAIATTLEINPIEIVDPTEWHRRNFGIKISQTSTEESPRETDLAPNEAYYIHRTETETQCYKTLLQAGGMVRIKAPQLMGKTWFIENVLSQFSEDESYHRLDIEIDRHVLTTLEDFYQWLCLSASEGLELPAQLDTYWRKGLAPSGNITNYFQKYLLSHMVEAQKSLILVLDKVDRVFESTNIANDFCALLRGWYEQPIKGNAQSRQAWRKLRLVIIHSTEVYGSLNINYSPLGSVGVDFKLSEFDAQQVQDLTLLYQLAWSEVEIQRLMDLIGGHPYLVHLAIAKVARQNISLDYIANTAYTEAGIYADHLRQLAIGLERSPDLESLYKEIVTADEPIVLKSVQAFKLDSMGLIQINPSPTGENLAEPRCRLYSEFFRNQFSD